MSSHPRLLLAAGLGVFLLGAWLFLSQKPSLASPPTVVERSQMAQTEVRDSFPSAESLAGPWVRRPHASNLPPPSSPSAPMPVDKSSVVFLGMYKERDDSQSFIFKYVPTGRVLILKVGRTQNGWSLKEYGDTSFTLSGPGGQYEVSR